MSRIKTSPKKFVKTSNSTTSTWVFLMKEDGLDDAETLEIVKLRHPASNQSAMFIFGPGNISIQEVLVFDDSKRSWFIDDNVRSNGKVYFSTPIDPLFLVLPYLRKSQQAQPLEQCLWDEDFLETTRLTECQNLKLELVADRKGSETLRAFKFNEEKALKWLQRKTEKVAKVLKDKGVNVSQGAISATYVKSTKYETGTEMEYLKYAHGIVSEYLQEDLAKMLSQYLNIPEDTENKKRKLSSPKDETDGKRHKNDKNVVSDENIISEINNFHSAKPAKPQKSATVSKKELARQRAAAGSKSIASFFTKK